MARGEFEYESYQLLLERGCLPERLTPSEIRRRCPAWNADRYTDGYFNSVGGCAESGRVVSWLVEQAGALGVEIHEGHKSARLIETDSRAAGVITADGSRFEAETVIVAAGTWAEHILPHLADMLRSNGMPVFHLTPVEPDLFRAERFPGFGADVTRTGYYGFPLHPRQGVVKIANHGLGRPFHPDSPERAVRPQEAEGRRDFLADTFPPLAEAPIVDTHVCAYCDTWDGHFWIDRGPDREGLVVATGGSGHAFKFAPMLGEWIADAAEGRSSPQLHKFRWRPEVHPPRTEEAARHQL